MSSASTRASRSWPSRWRRSAASSRSFDTEIADPETGRALAVAEAHWPDGLQPGQGPPVVLELDPADTDLNRLSALGYEIFTSTEVLLDFVRRRNTYAAGDVAAVDAG